MAIVLATDGEQRATLAVVRSLGGAGHEVYVCAASRNSLAGCSRFCTGTLVAPDPLTDAAGFRRSVAEFCRRSRVDVLLPVTEPAHLAILDVPSVFADVKVVAPPIDRFLNICDKRRTARAAAAAGILVPFQHEVSASADAPEDLRFPVVIKSVRSVMDHDGKRFKGSVSYASGWSQLTAILDATPQYAYPLLLQQRIVGPGVGVFVLIDEGELVAAFSHRRIREKPPSGGVSVYRESTLLDPDLLERSLALLKAFDWQGVAMVEYKLDASTGEPYLMEINGRLWGSLQLAVDSGVDFPRLMVDLAMGKKPAQVLTYRTGVRSRWWWGDVDHLLARIRHSPEALNLPPGEPSRMKVFSEFVRWRRNDQNEILRLVDPLPAVYESAQWLRGR
jgi:predicted ATP-grasp superfamily ATP-dependent carboligase